MPMSIWAFLGWNLILWWWSLGIGRLLGRLARQDYDRRWDAWIGFCGLLSLLPAIHLAMPMGRWAGGFLSAIALTGWLLSSDIRALKPLVTLRDLSWFSGWLLLLVVLGWPVGMGVSLHYDSGLYYQQVQSWVQACPAVPGLGNLHGRLAFPNTSFLLTGMLNGFTGWDWGARILGPFVLTRFVVDLLRSHLESQESGWIFQAWTSLVLALFALFALASPGAVVAAPDLIVAVLVCLAGLRFLEADSERKGVNGKILPFLVTMVLVKTSTAPLALFLLLASVWMSRSIPSLRSISIWGLFSAGWMSHSWVQSGYILFPFVGRLGNPDWAMRPDRVEAMVLAIRGWARWMGGRHLEALEGWWWFTPWLARTAKDPFLILCGAMLAMVFVVWILFGRDPRGFRIGGVPLLLEALGLATVIWFLSAPDIRFLTGLIWLSTAILCGALISGIRFPIVKGVLRGVLVVSMVAITLDLAHAPSTPLNPYTAFHPVRLPSGLVINVPDRGDQVWRAPIPATPEITDLVPRGPSLCDGFRDGGRPLRLVSPGVYEVAAQPTPKP